MIRVRTLATLATLSLLAGCYRMTVHLPPSQPDTTLERKIFVDVDDNSRWHHALIFGLIDVGETPVYKLCPEGVAAVHSRVTFLNAVAWGLTGGIYAPQTNTGVCVPAPAGEQAAADTAAAAPATTPSAP